MKTYFVIAWEENTFKTKFHQECEPNGTAIIEDADKFDTEEDAQTVINKNNWENCFVLTNEY